MSGAVKRQDKADIIAGQLQELYPVIPIPLDHTNAFELLVAVLMSAQTTDLKVNEVTPAPVSYTHLTLPTKRSV